MGPIKEEEYFPRGKSTSKTHAIRRTSDMLFVKHKVSKKKNKKPKTLEKKKKMKDATEMEALLNKEHKINPLNYHNLREGMVVMGRIREIWPYNMFVCLPGRLSAKLPVAAISTPYTKALEQSAMSFGDSEEPCLGLGDLFSVGQAVVCSIVQVVKEDNLFAVSVSLEPTLVNKGLNIQYIKAGSTFMAAVKSKEDHGYMLHTGINGLTAFLPFARAEKYCQRVNKGRQLVVGEVIRCLVTRCKEGKVEVTIDPEALNQTMVSRIKTEALLPGSRIRCLVEEVQKDGLVMLTEDKKKTFVESVQLKHCWSTPDHYQPLKELVVSVLYVMPQNILTNTPDHIYGTLKDLNTLVKHKLYLGANVNAVVVNSGFKGITLCLGEEKDNEIQNKGFVSSRRLGDSVNNEDIANNFPPGKEVTARILSYDYLGQFYNCSLEKDKLEQQYVRTDQLKVGDRISCVVTDIEEKGLKLSLGYIWLYAFKDHTADIPYDNLYQNFARGDIVDGRVLKVNMETRFITLTLKETLIRSPALTSYYNAKVGDSYWGTVMHVRENSLYVSFYNDVVGTVQLTAETGQNFFPGCLVKCCITYVNAQNEKLLLSINNSTNTPSCKITLGSVYELCVSKVDGECLHVTTCDIDSVEGIIPKCHLNDANMYKEGDFVKARLYLLNAGKYYFSPNRDVIKFITPIQSVKRHSTLTCCVEKIQSDRISFLTPLQKFRTVAILKKKCPWKLKPQQIVKLYVKYFNAKSMLLRVTCEKPKLTSGGKGGSSKAIEQGLTT